MRIMIYKIRSRWIKTFKTFFNSDVWPFAVMTISAECTVCTDQMTNEDRKRSNKHQPRHTYPRIMILNNLSKASRQHHVVTSFTKTAWTSGWRLVKMLQYAHSVVQKRQKSKSSQFFISTRQIPQFYLRTHQTLLTLSSGKKIESIGVLKFI